MRSRHHVRRLTALALAALLGACDSPQVDRPGPPPPLELRASMSQPRSDEGTDKIRAAVINAGARRVHVRSATLQWSGFGPSRTDIRDGRVEPGEAVAFTIRHGEARCGSPQADEPHLAVVVNGKEEQLPLDEADRATLSRLHLRACNARALDAVVEVSLELEPAIVADANGEHVAGNVVLMRRRDAVPRSLTVVDLGGSVLLRLAPEGQRLPFTLPPARSRAVLPVSVTPTHRCDAHALGNSSQTFLLSVYLRVEGGLEHRVVTVPDPRARSRLAALIDRDCA